MKHQSKRPSVPNSGRLGSALDGAVLKQSKQRGVHSRRTHMATPSQEREFSNLQLKFNRNAKPKWYNQGEAIKVRETKAK